MVIESASKKPIAYSGLHFPRSELVLCIKKYLGYPRIRLCHFRWHPLFHFKFHARAASEGEEWTHKVSRITSSLLSLAYFYLCVPSPSPHAALKAPTAMTEVT